MRIVNVNRLITLLMVGMFIALAVNRYFLIPLLATLVIAVFLRIRLRCSNCGRNVYLKRMKASGTTPERDYDSGSMVDRCYGCGTDLGQVQFDWKMLGKKWKPAQSSSYVQPSLSKESLLGLFLIALGLIGPTIVSTGVSARAEAGILGFMFVSMGLYLLSTWRSHVSALIAQEERKQTLIRKWFGFAPPYSEKWVSRFAGGVSIFVGAMFVIGGSLMLFTFITGRDWPLHHARWSDIWPF